MTEEPPKSFSEILLGANDDQSELDKVLQELFKPENLKHVTELTQTEISQMSQLAVMAIDYNLETLKKLIIENLTFRVSRGRGGRKDFVKIATREIERSDDMERRTWMRDRESYR